jgi:hypothetical protein
MARHQHENKGRKAEATRQGPTDEERAFCGPPNS